MTKDEALNLALQALETLMIERGSIYDKATTAIREALTQPEPEYLAFMDTPQRKPLTDEEKDRLANAWFSKDGDTDVAHRKAIALIEEVEAAHGIKGEA